MLVPHIIPRKRPSPHVSSQLRQVIREGRTIATIEVRVFNEAGKLVAKGTHVKHLGTILTSSL